MNPIHVRSLPVWGALALVSLTFGAWLGMQPGRSEDFALVRVWLDYWTSTWTSPYVALWLNVDYPPHALVLLQPLDWLPAHGTAWFMAGNLAATVSLAWLLTVWFARETATPITVRHQLVFACMLLAWGAMRASLWHGQTVMAATIAGVYAVRLASRSAWISGVAFALAATKPTLGAAFGLILLMRGAQWPFVIGVAVALGLTVVFDITVGAAPLSSIGDYATSLVHVYTGESRVRGVTTIRSAMVDLANGHPAAHLVFALYSGAAFVAFIHTAWPRRTHPDAQLLIATACLLWILLALPNQRYYLILLAPLVWLLTWTPQAWSRSGARWPQWAASGLILFSVIDTPVFLRHLAEYFGDVSPFSLEWLWIASYVVVGPVVIACFVMVLLALRRITVTRAT